jgi:hypothetical protein
MISKVLTPHAAHPTNRGDRERLRHFGEAPKCPREVRPCDFRRLAGGIATSTGKLQNLLALVAN